jgi:PAS domain S-box-containing protein
VLEGERHGGTDAPSGHGLDASWADGPLRAALEAAPGAMIVVDGGGAVVLANRWAQRLFDRTPEDLVGCTVDRLFPEGMQIEHPDVWAVLLGELPPETAGERRELAALRRDGREVAVEIGLTSLVTASQTFVLGSLVDVSERKQATAALACQNAALERSNREAEQFAYVASHDLQEPLRMVGSYVQLLARRYQGRLDANADEFIGYAVEGVMRMQALLNELLAFSRLGRCDEPLAETSCDEALETALGSLADQMASAGAAVTHDALPTLVATRALVVELFQNLIENAVKFRGDQPPRIYVGAARKGADWLFAVSDNGIGIDPRHGERIFEIFQRLHTRDRYPGNGMGLARCRKIVERLGGRLWVESRPRAGSTFFFTLPAAGPPVDSSPTAV